jgi:hypothetical protein
MADLPAGAFTVSMESERPFSLFVLRRFPGLNR